MGTTNEGAKWLEAFNERAEEAAILARQNVKIAACNLAAGLILNHPDAGEHRAEDTGSRVREQTVPIKTGSGRNIVVGRVFQGDKMSLRTVLRANGTGGLSFLELKLQQVYSRELTEGGDPDPDGPPAEGRPDTGVLPAQGVAPFLVPPGDPLEGSFGMVPHTEDNIVRFSDHVTAVAATLDIELPAGNEIVGITRTRRLE